MLARIHEIGPSTVGVKLEKLQIDPFCFYDLIKNEKEQIDTFIQIQTLNN